MAGSKGSDHLLRFQRLFKGRENVYGQTRLGKNGEKAASWTEHKGTTDKQWQIHLAGKGVGLGVGASRTDNTCYFGAIDVDDPDVNHAALAAIIEHANLPLVVCRSKSGGAHLFVFMKDPVPATLMVEKLREWAKALGLKNAPQMINDKLVVRDVEIFPKNPRLAPSDEGNWINLPYYGNGSTTRYAVKADGTSMSLDDFLDLAEQESVSSSELEGIRPANNPFMEGPPCLETLNGLGYPEGSRNDGLYNVGIFFKLQDEATWQEKTRQYNQEHMDPPLKNREVESIINSLSRRDYTYKCEDLPIQPHCEKKTCKKRRFGVGGFRRKKNEENMPDMGNLRKVLTDPPRWILNVDGNDIDFRTEDLMLVPRFRKAVLERCDRVFPLIRQADWDDLLSQLLEDHETIEAPEDAGTLGQFRHLVNEFLLRRLQSQSKEDLLGGMPWEDGPKTFFRAADLLAFLDRKKFKEYTASEVYSRLRSIGAGHDKLGIKGAQVQVWFLPTPTGQQTEEFTPRSSGDPEF